MQSRTMLTTATSRTIAPSLTMLFVVHLLLWLYMAGSGVTALTCFETNEDGDMVEVTNEDYTYCVLLPERTDNNKYMEGKAFGVSPASDSTSAYDKIFHLNNEVYQVLSMCIYERYDFGKISPKFSFKQPEFMLRCFCNFDGCNREKNFFSYINNLKADSAALTTKVEATTRR